MLPVVPPEVHREMFDILFSSIGCSCPPESPPSQNMCWSQAPPQNYSSPTSTVFTFQPNQLEPSFHPSFQPPPQYPTHLNTSVPNQQPQFQFSMCPPLPNNQPRYIGLDPRFHADEPYKLKLTHDRNSSTEDSNQTQNPRLPMVQVNIANMGAQLEYPPMPKRPNIRRNKAAGECACSCACPSYQNQGNGADPNGNAIQAKRNIATETSKPEKRNKGSSPPARPTAEERGTVTEQETPVAAAQPPPGAPTRQPVARPAAAVESTQTVNVPTPDATPEEPTAAGEPAKAYTAVQPVDAPSPDATAEEPIAAGEPATASTTAQPVDATTSDATTEEPIAAGEPATASTTSVESVDTPTPGGTSEELIATVEPTTAAATSEPDDGSTPEARSRKTSIASAHSHAALHVTFAPEVSSGSILGRIKLAAISTVFIIAVAYLLFWLVGNLE